MREEEKSREKPQARTSAEEPLSVEMRKIMPPAYPPPTPPLGALEITLTPNHRNQPAVSPAEEENGDRGHPAEKAGGIA